MLSFLFPSIELALVNCAQSVRSSGAIAFQVSPSRRRT